MKVDRAAADKADRTDAPSNTRNIQPQTSANPSPLKSADQPNQGAFSKVLESARPANDSDRPETKAADPNTDPSVEGSNETKDHKSVDGNESRRDGQESFGGDADGGDGSAWAAAPQVSLNTAGTETNGTVPPARSILHVTDLERIVSAVRSESFAGTKQVTIDLKNSVLDGLRITLTLTEQGNLKAEFVALNEQIKKQLDARRSELQSVLKSRSIKCGELMVKVAEPEAETFRPHTADVDAVI